MPIELELALFHAVRVAIVAVLGQQRLDLFFVALLATIGRSVHSESDTGQADKGVEKGFQH